ncbi:MAG: hypothetical protein OQK46_01595 [Gammaproteobacteria bacterium]|nr:hypothetical protein [Gammaproteobacteria bacterium]
MSFAGIKLIVPQSEILSIESIYELESNEDNDNNYIGVIYRQGIKLPVYCFSKSMEIYKSLPEDRFQCVVLQHENIMFSLLCYEISNAIISEIEFHNLPICMNNQRIPLTHLCLYKDAENINKLGMVTSTVCLNEYINKLNRYSIKH